MSSGFQQQSSWDMSWLCVSVCVRERERDQVKTDAKKSKTWVFSWAPHVVKVLREWESTWVSEREETGVFDCRLQSRHPSHFYFSLSLRIPLSLSLSRVFIHTFWWDPAVGIWNWSTPQSAHISIICLFYGFPCLSFSLSFSLSQSTLKNKIPLSFFNLAEQVVR